MHGPLSRLSASDLSQRLQSPGFLQAAAGNRHRRTGSAVQQSEGNGALYDGAARIPRRQCVVKPCGHVQVSQRRRTQPTRRSQERWIQITWNSYWRSTQCFRAMLAFQAIDWQVLPRQRHLQTRLSALL